jgi:hypothetical protein
MYINKTVSGERPETDVIVMFKMLVLQQWRGLSDFRQGGIISFSKWMCNMHIFYSKIMSRKEYQKCFSFFRIIEKKLKKVKGHMFLKELSGRCINWREQKSYL